MCEGISAAISCECEHLTMMLHVVGSPLKMHGSVDGAAAGLSQLQLHPQALSPTLSHSPRHSTSTSVASRPLSPATVIIPSLYHPNNYCSPCPSPRAGPSPPPVLALGSIIEEPSKRQKPFSCHVFKKTPQISITDETGDQFLITSTESSPDDGLDAMETSFSSPLTPENGGLPCLSTITQQLSPHIHLVASLSSPLPSSQLSNAPQRTTLSKSASLSNYSHPAQSPVTSPRQRVGSGGKFLKGFSLDFPIACDTEGPSITRGTVGRAPPIGQLLHTHYHSLQDNNNSSSIPARNNERNLVRQDAVMEQQYTISNNPCSTSNARHQMFITNSEFRHSFPPLSLSCREPPQAKDEDQASVIISLDSSNQSEEHSSLHHHNNTNILSGFGESNRIHKTESGSIVLMLPNKWYGMQGNELVEALLQAVETNAPYLVNEGVNENRLSLRDETGVRVDLEVTHNTPQSLKMRRMAGNELQYTQICQQLINCMTT